MNKPVRILATALMLVCIAVGGGGIWSYVMLTDPVTAVGGLIGGFVCMAIGIYGLHALNNQ